MKTIVNLLKRRNLFNSKEFYNVIVNGKALGFTHYSYQKVLETLDPCISISGNNIHIQTPTKDFSTVTSFFKQVNQRLVEKKVLHVTHDSEMCPIGIEDINQPLFDIYRYAIPFWGMRLCGVHLNGLRKIDGDLYMWISRRTLNRNEPGKLDHLACGAVVSELGIKKNLYKEAEEEAGIPSSLMDMALPVGVVACSFQRDLYICRYTPFIYDLWIPSDFAPISLDSSSSEFFMMRVEDLLKKPSQLEEFKSATQLVIINLLIRYGFIKPDMPYYTTIAALLQQDLILSN